MQKVANGAWKDEILEYAPVENTINQRTDWSKMEHRHTTAEGDPISCSFLEQDVLQIEHLFSEAEISNVLNEESLYFSSIASDNFSSDDVYPCAVSCYLPKDGTGMLEFNAANVKQESDFEFVSCMLEGIDDKKKLQSVCGFSSDNPDNLDSSYSTNCHQNSTLPSGPIIKSLDSNIQTQAMIDNISAYKQTEAGALSCLPESTSDDCALLLDKMDIDELHDVFRSMFGMNACFMDQKWLKHHIFFALQNLTDLDDDCNLLENGYSLANKEDSLILIPGTSLTESVCSPLACVPGYSIEPGSTGIETNGHSVQDVVVASLGEAGTTEVDLGEEKMVPLPAFKKLRIPVERHVESKEETKLDYSKRVENLVSSKETFGTLRRDKGVNVNWAKSTLIGYHEHSGSFHFQLSSEMPFSRRHPRKVNSTMGDSAGLKPYNLRSSTSRRSYSTSKDSDDDIEDDGATTIKKRRNEVSRKHHRQWTLSEVMKLVEGVSQYGVGKWTEIKKLLFSTSAYRTSVDLKDKWRNLLRASGAQFHGKTKDASQRKHMTIPIPQSVLRQVRELATIHPYPRLHKSKISRAAVTPTLSSIKDGSVSRRGRTPRSLS